MTLRFHAWLALLALLAVLAVLPASSGSWILDDVPLIARNLRLHDLRVENTAFLLSHDMWNLDFSALRSSQPLSYYRPLVMLSYALDWWWGGGSTTAFHVTNSLLHALTVLLAGRCLLRWSGNATGSLLAAAFFGLHPARAESVAWISGRPDVLATLGLLVCLEGVAKAGSARRALAGTLFLAGAVIAFGSKETALLLPLLVAIELFSAEGAASLRARIKAWPLAAAAVASAAYLVARHLWLPMRPFPIKGLDLATHAGFVFETVGRATMFLLAPFDLSSSGPMLTERGGKVAPEPYYLLLGVGASLALLATLAWTRRHEPRSFWALLAFLISSMPTLNIFWIGGIGLTSPRFFYLPSLLLGWFAIEAGRGRFKAVSTRVAVLAVAGLSATLTLLLALQSNVYRSAEQFWTAELRSRPDVPEPIDYFARSEWERGDNERALARSLCEYQIAQERFSFRAVGARIVLNTLQSWAAVLPDAEGDQLSAIAEFLAAAREPNGSARLGLQLSLEIPAESKVRRELQRRSVEGQTLEAEIRVRLGQRKQALELLLAARAGCPRCEDLRDRQARVAYRAFDAELAEKLAERALDEPWGKLTTRELLARLRTLNARLELAQGPELTRLQLQRLSEVGLYGQALALLQQSSSRAVTAEADHELERLTLSYAALAGDRALVEQLAKRLQLPTPPLPPLLSIPQAKRYLSQLHDGCAFPEELL